MLTDGEPVRPPALRLTMDQIRAARTAALMQNELVRQNEIAHELRGASELRDFASPDELAQTLRSCLPDDKREAIHVLHDLLLETLKTFTEHGRSVEETLEASFSIEQITKFPFLVSPLIKALAKELPEKNDI